MNNCKSHKGHYFSGEKDSNLDTGWKSYTELGATLLPGVVDLFTESPEEKKIELLGDKYIEDAQNLANTPFRGSNATLLEQSKNLPVWKNVDIDDFGGETNLWSAGLSGLASGAVAGAATGNPFVIGGAALVNGLTNLFNANDINSQKRDQIYRVNKAGRDAMNRVANNFNAAVTTTDQANDRWRMQNMFNTNYAAEGGLLETNGAMWQSGSDFVDNGGTHEMNPFGGVQYGIASDGLPNFVEEGEVVIDLEDSNDAGHSYAEGGNPNTDKYVLSNRVTAGEEELPLLKLLSKKPKQYIGMTYADIYKDIFKKNGIEELANRQDIKDYINSLNTRIARAQEATKLREEQAQLIADLKNATPEEQEMIMQQFGMNQQQPMQGEYLAAEGGKIYIKPSKRGTFTAAAKSRGMGVQEFARHVLANKEDYSSIQVKRANFARNASHWHQWGGWNNQQELDNYYNAQLLNFYKQSHPNATAVPASYYLRGKDARAWVNQLAAGDEQQIALANALKSSWGDENTDWSNNATWEFKNKYNPKGTIVESQPYLDYYKESPKKVDALWGVLHSPRLELISTQDKSSPEIILPTGPQSIQRYWKYDWNTGERTPATAGDFDDIPTGWYIDESLNEEGPDDETGNIYYDYYLSNKSPVKYIDSDNTNTINIDNTALNNTDWILPAISGASVLEDMLGLTNTPDYSNANRIGRAILPPTLIGYNPNGRYVKPRLVDTRYLAARLANQGLAGIGAAKDLSGANRATALANIAAQNYLTQQAIGESIAQGQAADNEAIQKAVEINNAVDRANAEGALQADRANQSILENYAQRYAVQKTAEAKLREDIDNQVSANRSANWNNFLENLEGYFENTRNRNLANSAYSAYGYTIDHNGNVHYNSDYDKASDAEKKKIEESAKKKQAQLKKKNNKKSI